MPIFVGMTAMEKVAVALSRGRSICMWCTILCQVSAVIISPKGSSMPVGYSESSGKIMLGGKGKLRSRT